MSHISPMNTVTGTMNLPLVVAALTSVGLHSLIWFYQPVVPMADKATAGDRRSVRVVQLSPEEILRLPEYAQQKTQPTLPNLPLGQVPTNLLPSLPQAKSEITLPPPPSFPIYNPNPSLPSPTPEPKTPTSRRRNRTTVPKSPQDAAKNNRRNNQSSRNQKPETTGKITIDQLNLESQLPPPERTRSQSQQRNESQQNGQTSGGEFGESYQRYLAQQNLDSTSQSTQSRQSETQTQNNQSQNNQQTIGELLDRNRLQPGLGAGATSDKSQNRDDVSTTRTQNRNDSRNNRNQVDEEARIKAVYGYNAASTTIPQGIANYDRWLEKIKKYPNRSNSKRKPITDSIRSSFDIKLPDVTPAGIVVLVDPEGKIVETELIRSTGYKQLNDLAIAQVKKRSFPATGKYEVYPYLIEVDQKDLSNASDAANRSTN